MKNRHRPLLAPALLLAVAASGCATAGSAAGPISVYKPLGSLQCSGGGTPVATLARQLADAGVVVLASRCGSDGRMRAAVCGGADGRLGLFDIASADAAQAQGLGFLPLAQLPGAHAVPCQPATNTAL
jgi:hypothetical protein